MKRLIIILFLYSELFFTQSTFARTLDDIMRTEKLIIGVRKERNNLKDQVPPISYGINNKRVGIDVDLSNIIAEKLNVEPKYQPLDNSEMRISCLEKSGCGIVIDIVIDSLSINLERMEKIDFVDVPYVEESGTGLLLLKKHKDRFKTLESIKEGQNILTIAVESCGSTMYRDLIKAYPEINIKTFTSGFEAFEAFINGETDGFAQDYPVLALKQDPNRNYLLPGQIAPGSYGIGIAKNNTELKNKLNEILLDLKVSGKLREIKNRHSFNEIPPDNDGAIQTEKDSETYEIVAGDTLTSIAKNKCNSSLNWKLIQNSNIKIIPIANIIHPKTRIIIPKACATTTNATNNNFNYNAQCSDLHERLHQLRNSLINNDIQQNEHDYLRKEMLHKCFLNRIN